MVRIEPGVLELGLIYLFPSTDELDRIEFFPNEIRKGLILSFSNCIELKFNSLAFLLGLLVKLSKNCERSFGFANLLTDRFLLKNYEYKLK